MSKTILYIATSIDGYVAGKKDDLSWLTPYESVDYEYDKFFGNIGATITGRRTYDLGIEKGWAWPYPVPSFILSSNIPKQLEKNADLRFVSGELTHILEKAKIAARDKDIWVTGGAHVAQAFLEQNLIDTLIITIVPVMLGEGIRLFENNGVHAFELVKTRTFDKGLVQITYNRQSQ